jgi:hypothetical protein
VTTSKDWKTIYKMLTTELTAEGFEFDRRVSTPDEEESGRSHSIHSTTRVNGKHANECLPGRLRNVVPYSPIIDTVQKISNVKTYHPLDLYDDVRFIYGSYSVFDENELFFFRNNDVPYTIKEAVRPLIFPASSWLTPALCYLSDGYRFSEKKAYGPALSCYYAALFSSNTLLASPLVKAYIRSIIFDQLSKAHLAASKDRVYTSGVFKLGADLNAAYVTSEEGVSQANAYEMQIRKIEDICNTAEDKARQIRGEKRMGGVLAAVNYAGAAATASATDNTTSQMLMDQGNSTLTASFNQAGEASKLLADQFTGIQGQVHSGDFITSGESADVGRSFLAGEVLFYLQRSPNLVRDVLLKYSADKPHLHDLIITYYNESNTARKSAILGDIYRHVSGIEAAVVNYEIRNYPVPEKIKSTF